MYYLMAILAYSVILGNFGSISYSSINIVISVVYITFFVVGTNVLFSKIFDAPTNMESSYISSLILVFLITPPTSIVDIDFLYFAFLAAILLSASKYIFTINKKHVFNQAAIAILLAGIMTGQAASWWVGNISLLPVIVIAGFILLRKISRFELVLSFLAAFVVSVAFTYEYVGIQNLLIFIYRAIFYSPTFFFAFIMLTEPLTSPTMTGRQIIYGIIVGALFNPLIHLGNFYFTPELSLLFGNVYAYFVSSKIRVILKLKNKVKIAQNVYDFVFTGAKQIPFISGQYMEWTLPHDNIDNRGNRRYFTMASSQDEEDIHIGVKFYENGSSFKKSLLRMKKGEKIVASQVSGNFILPKKREEKVVFLAGGIGVTPFRSMIEFLINKAEDRDIILLFYNNIIEDIAYTDFFDKAEARGIKIIYFLTDTSKVPGWWRGEVGYISAKSIMKFVEDYKERRFYVSGPHSMVVSTKKILYGMKLKKKQIKSDFFPGLV